MNTTNNPNNWIDDIDDIDSFLDQIIAINEQSIETSPLLSDFCNVIETKLNTLNKLKTEAFELAMYDLSSPSELCSHSINKTSIEVLRALSIKHIESTVSISNNQSVPAYTFEIGNYGKGYSAADRILNKAA